MELPEAKRNVKVQSVLAGLRALYEADAVAERLPGDHQVRVKFFLMRTVEYQQLTFLALQQREVFRGGLDVFEIDEQEGLRFQGFESPLYLLGIFHQFCVMLGQLGTGFSIANRSQ